MKTAKEFWRKQQIDTGMDESIIDEVAEEMFFTFQIMEDYAKEALKDQRTSIIEVWKQKITELNKHIKAAHEICDMYEWNLYNEDKKEYEIAIKLLENT